MAPRVLLHGCSSWLVVSDILYIFVLGTFELTNLFIVKLIIKLNRWFVWGSVVAMLTAVVPLLQEHIHFFNASDDTLPVLDFYSTWAMLIVSGFFFTVGSYAFVRAFEDPPVQPMFTWRHLETDELVGAWMFFLGTAPAIPYAATFYILYPHEIIYLGALIVAGVFVLGTLLFVFACYPSEKVCISHFLVCYCYSFTLL